MIDLGPEAGRDGGQVVVEGTPETVVAHALRVAKAKRKLKTALPSYTGLAMAEVLDAGPYKKRPNYQPTELPSEEEERIELSEIGKDADMPWEADGRMWHTKTRVGRNGKDVKWDGEICHVWSTSLNPKEAGAKPTGPPIRR